MLVLVGVVTKKLLAMREDEEVLVLVGVVTKKLLAMREDEEVLVLVGIVTKKLLAMREDEEVLVLVGVVCPPPGCHDRTYHHTLEEDKPIRELVSMKSTGREPRFHLRQSWTQVKTQKTKSIQ